VGQHMYSRNVLRDCENMQSTWWWSYSLEC